MSQSHTKDCCLFDTGRSYARSNYTSQGQHDSSFQSQTQLVSDQMSVLSREDDIRSFRDQMDQLSESKTSRDISYYNRKRSFLSREEKNRAFWDQLDQMSMGKTSRDPSYYSRER